MAASDEVWIPAAFGVSTSGVRVMLVQFAFSCRRGSGRQLTAVRGLVGVEVFGEMRLEQLDWLRSSLSMNRSYFLRLAASFTTAETGAQRIYETFLVRDKLIFTIVTTASPLVTSLSRVWRRILS